MGSKITAKINLGSKETISNDEACGSCFHLVDPKDAHCWNCGARFISKEYPYFNYANNLEELLTLNKEADATNQ